MKALLILFALVLTACGGGNESSPQPRETSAPSPQAHIFQAAAPMWTAAQIKPRIIGPVRAALPAAVNAPEGIYTQQGTPALLVDAEGHFWALENIDCARNESGLFTAGVASAVQDDQKTGVASCSVLQNGPATLAFTASLTNGVLSLAEADTYWTVADPSQPPEGSNIVLASASYTYTLTPAAFPPVSIAGTYPEGLLEAWQVMGSVGNPPPDSITIAPDGTFTLLGCDWIAALEDEAVNIYTVTSSCGVGLLTLINGQLLGGVTIGTTVVDL